MIECYQITKIYKNNEVETQALRGISLKIKRGEFVAVMGPSGSGKSTLMHILGCLDTPTSGQYFLNGENVSNFSDDQLSEIRLKKIGFVFQSFNLLPRATVLRNVMLPLVYAKFSKKERELIAKEALRESAFPEKFWNHYSNQLSGGMMQRVAIARALVNNPDLILADEPTGNLDTKTGEAILAAFQHLHRKGRTIILVTHEPYVAQCAERILHIRDGSIFEDEIVKERRIIKDF
ncbi:MAG: ABC transporter ATP-binding protein [Patescibacteria group bacterium]|nr:ABC transporter ATP-binding protein [Patescibacteria group bacterium]